MSKSPSILVSPKSKQLNGQSRQVPNLGIRDSQDINHIISPKNEETLNNSPNFTQQDQASRFADAYGTLNDRNEDAKQQEVPQTIMDMERDEPYTYTMNNSGSLDEMDMSAPPSIPVGNSDEKSNLISLQKVDEGSRPKIITPSDWGAPDMSQRTGPNHNMSQSRHSEFTNNNYEGGDK